jgi:chromate reductase
MIVPRSMQLLGLSGSLRRHSYCTAVLQTIAQSGLAPAAFAIHDLAEVRLYNQDHDGADAPVPVRALREAVEQCDGLVIITPEYNHGISGVLKNAI